MRISLLMLGILLSQSLYAQLIVNSNVSDNELISALLGQGVTVSNVQVKGGTTSRGVFSQGDNINLEIKEGIVFATGNVNEIPQSNTILAASVNELVSDPLISQFYPTFDLHDLAIIEFDFVATADALKFNFVFASEEYPGFVCSDYNDIFGFILSEVTSSGELISSKNIAKIPGTEIDISINTVNNGISNGNAQPCLLNNTQYFKDNYSSSNPDFVFGGYTSMIPINMQVVRNKKYHIKMFVSDVYDDNYNSAVFLEAKSFTIEDPFTCDECIPSFSPLRGEEYVLSAWVKEEYFEKFPDTYSHSGVRIAFNEGNIVLPLMKASGPIIEGWQRIEASFVVPPDAQNIQIQLVNDDAPQNVYFDDIRVHPFRSNMKSFVYDPSTQKLIAELDENNYSTRYEYDDEGILIRVKKETERGVMTIKETRMNQSKINTK